MKEKEISKKLVAGIMGWKGALVFSNVILACNAVYIEEN